MAEPTLNSRILAAVASISARSGSSHMGSAAPEAILAMIKVDRGAFVRAVKALADRKLVEINDDTVALTLTSAGISRLAADALPPGARARGRRVRHTMVP